MQDIPGPDEEIMRIGASAARRWIGVVSVGGLGLLLIASGLGAGPGAVWSGIFVIGGAAALWGALRMERATRAVLVLTPTALSEEGGAELARIEEIERVDRSMFAMKPSNGFLLLLKAPRDRAWRPGLWWRLGRRVAVGGVTAGSATRPMADAITFLILQRDGKAPRE